MAKIQSATSLAGKETIYVDVDDEITAIIDKVRGAKGKVIALVLPKRATVLQSIVNMKLLKRTAENSQKNLVLITSEAGLLPLAGSVGLYVAETPTSKPSIPAAPDSPSDEPEEIDEPLDIVDNSVAGAEPDFDPKKAADKPVGELAGAGVVASKISDDDIDESIDMDDAAADADEPVEAKKSKPKKDKKLAVPSFDSLKKKMVLGVGILALLIVAYVFAFIVLPKATITIKTDSSTISTNLTLSLDTTAKTLDTSNDTLPATSQSQAKTTSQQVASTGQQNNGQKANGQITLALKDCNTDAVTIPTGSGLTSNGLTYITQSEVDLVSIETRSGKSYNCSDPPGTVNVIALKGGTNYNESNGSSFSVSSSINGGSDVSAKATSDISGGTDNITKIVAQADIDSATAKIKSADATSIKQQLVTALQAKGLQAIDTTFLAGTPQVSASAKVGDAVDNVTVTAITTYSMLGVKQADLKSLVTANVTKQLDKGKQVILDDGVANAVFAEPNPGTATAATVTMEAKSTAGPQLNVATLKPQLYGKKSGDIQALLKQTPGVTSVNVKYSPFWVSVVPKKASKVTVQIDKTGSQ